MSTTKKWNHGKVKEKSVANIWNSGKADEDDEEMESWKSKRADDRMHKISFHADKICHTGKYGKQPNTKYQKFSEQIISYFSRRNKYDFVRIYFVIFSGCAKHQQLARGK